MADSMRIDPHGLRAAEPAFGSLASSVDVIVRRLVDALHLEGECWGGDRTGAAFAESYAPAAQQTRAAIEGLRDGVRGVGEALLAVADNIDAAEVRTQTRFT
jgi:hypothetical protein